MNLPIALNCEFPALPRVAMGIQAGDAICLPLGTAQAPVTAICGGEVMKTAPVRGCQLLSSVVWRKGWRGVLKSSENLETSMFQAWEPDWIHAFHFIY